MQMNKMSVQPFIYKFQTDQNNYIYDINSNEIIKADETVYDIIDYIGCLSSAEIVQKFKSKYDKLIITECIQSLEEARKDGFFLEQHPTLVSRNIDEVKSAINGKIAMITLETTQNCNLRCRYCVFSDKYPYTRGYYPKYMDFKTAKTAIDYYIAHSLDVIDSDGVAVTFYGGEPLLNFELIKACVEYVKSLEVSKTGKVHYHMTTNGTLLNPEISQFLVDNNFNILISLDINKEYHDRNRVYPDGRGSYETIENNLMLLKEKYPDYYARIRFNSLMCPPYDFLKLQEVISSSDILSGHQIDLGEPSALNSTYYDNFSDEEKDDPVGRQILIRKYIDAITTKNDKGNRIDIMGPDLTLATYLAEHSCIVGIYLRDRRHLIKDFNGRLVPGASCVPGVMRMYVTVDEDIYVCERCGLGNEFYKVGNVSSGIQFDKAIKIINDSFTLYQDECSDCWVCRMCGLCFIYLYDGSGLSTKQKKVYCDSYRNSMHNAIINFCRIMEKNPKAYDSWNEN